MRANPIRMDAPMFERDHCADPHDVEVPEAAYSEAYSQRAIEWKMPVVIGEEKEH